jgi:hypothetical protein
MFTLYLNSRDQLSFAYEHTYLVPEERSTDTVLWTRGGGASRPADLTLLQQAEVTLSSSFDLLRHSHTEATERCPIVLLMH